MVKGTNRSGKIKKHQLLSQSPDLTFTSTTPEKYFCYYSQENCVLLLMQDQSVKGKTRRVCNRISLISQLQFSHHTSAFHSTGYSNSNSHKIIVVD